MPREITRNSFKLVEAREVVNILAWENQDEFEDNPFYNRILLPNDRKERDERHIALSHELIQHARTAISKGTSGFVKDPKSVALTFCNFFKAWNKLIPNATSDDYIIMRPHSGTEVLCNVLAKLMRTDLFKDRVPDTEEFIDLFQSNEKVSAYLKPSVWKRDNMVGFENPVGIVHGKAAATKLATSRGDTGAKTVSKCQTNGGIHFPRLFLLEKIILSWYNEKMNETTLAAAMESK